METMYERPRYGGVVLRRFGLSDQSLLGTGGESRVYALNDERVLRVCGPGTTEAKVGELQDFYDRLDDSDVDFAVPEILEFGWEGDFLFSIETRLPGRSLTAASKELGDEARKRALREFVHAAGQVRMLRRGFNEYGELLARKPLRRKTWPEFLIDRAHLTLKRSREDLSSDIRELDRVVTEWESDVRSVAGSPEPELVHGDFFPGNILVEDSGKVTAVIDFSPHSVAGDWRLDVTGAQVFLGLGDVDEPGDQQIVVRELASLYGVPPEIVDVYRRYYALYFSAVGGDDPPTYEWCVRQLRRGP